MVAAISTAAAACVDREDGGSLEPKNTSLSSYSFAEGELMGDIFSGTTNDYYVELSPRSSTDDDWVKGAHSWRMWADTGRHFTSQGRRNWMFEWADPNDGGICGSLDAYNSGGARATEVHKEYEGHVPTEPEKHCIRPGRYWFRVYKGVSSDVLVKEFEIEYLAGAATAPGAVINVLDTMTGDTQSVQSATPLGAASVHDFVVNIDRQSGTYTETAVLDLENVGSVPYDTTFANQAIVAGNENDHFRASVARSSVGWNRHTRGRMLAQLQWDTLQAGKLATFWYNPNSGQNDRSIIRTMQYGDTVSQSRDIPVGLVLMRPDEAIAFTRAQTVPPIADITVQSENTWQYTDQYLTVGRSARGTSIRYSWSSDGGVSWTPETTDTLYDFPGHGSTGNQTVTLKVRDVNTGLSRQVSRAINVSSGTVNITGDTYITVKTSYPYSSNITADWFERFNPQIAFTRITPQGFPTNSISRIWPAGNYTVELRQQDSTPALLKRGRSPITVCTTGGGCLEPLMASSRVVEENDEVFGAGPVISWGNPASRQAASLYDLMGMHAGDAFRSRDWRNALSGSAALPFGGQLTWNRRNLSVAEALAFDFNVSLGTQGHVFGFAVDPDIGEPGDDASGFDESLGLAYAMDGQTVYGMMLVSGSAGPASVWQYGAGRFAPTNPAAVWQAQRTNGVSLMPGRNDVQFLVSAAPKTGTAAYTVVMLRASSVDELRTRAAQAKAQMAQ
jgi:hypothetical protein